MMSAYLSDTVVFVAQYYANFVISLMAQLCAPLRDDEITHLKQLTDIVPLYRYALSNPQVCSK